MPKYRDGRRNNRPPVKNQFKPGKSGNGKGRPSRKTTISANEIVGRLLRAKHPIVLRGRQQLVPFVEIVFMRIFELALKGNDKCLMWTMDLIDKSEIVETDRIKQPDMTEFRKKLENMTEQELEAELRRTFEERADDFGPKR